MKMRDIRGIGLRGAILAAMAVATGCGGQPADVGESDIGATIDESNAKPSLNKKSPFGNAPSLKPQNGGGPVGVLPQNKLLPSDGQAHDEFGVSVGISGNTVVVGSIYDDDLGGDAGSAYVFVEDNGVWTQQAKLMAKDARANDYFGISVAIAGDRILVGAAEAGNNNSHTGAVYVYERVNKVWSLVQKLTPVGGTTNDYFGYAVALEGNVAVIGAPQADQVGFDSGAAFIYRHDGTQFVEEDRIWASTGGAFGFFGGSVAISGSTVLVGQWDDGSAQNKGSVFAYRENAGTWLEEDELIASDASANDTFGFSLAIYNSKAFIGAPFRDGACVNSGAVYVFGRYNDTWCQEQIIEPEDKNASQAFGSAVGLWGDMAAIGSYWDQDNGDYSGSVYAYRYVEKVWSPLFKYLPNDGVVGQLFGISVAMDNDRVVAGANGDDDNGIDSGAAYQFSVLENPNSPPPVVADEPPEVALKADAPSAQCSVNTGATPSSSSWFVAFGLAALGMRRLSRRNRA